MRQKFFEISSCSHNDTRLFKILHFAITQLRARKLSTVIYTVNIITAILTPKYDFYRILFIILFLIQEPKDRGAFANLKETMNENI